MTEAPLRMMLVELVPHESERVNRSQAYPWLMGLARRCGWRAWWRILGVRYDPALRYALEPRDLGLLLAEVRRLKPGVLVINERLQDGQRAALASAGSRARIVYCPLELAEHFSFFAGFVRRHIRRTRALDDPCLFDKIQPVFRRRMLNRAPWLSPPFIRVVAGRYCSYRTRADDNPFYRGLKLPSAFINCSFCDSARPFRPPIKKGALSFAVRVIEAACRQRRDAGGAIRFELSGSELWSHLSDLIETLARRGIRDAELHFMPRVDALLAARGSIARCLPLLARNGLAMRIYGMSVENFSPAENLRLNKGITAEQVHEAAAFLISTNAHWPGQFQLPPGGLSMILFTPWTTLEDLRINVEHIERCPLIDRDFALGRRLHLFPERPITVLAEHDGLVAKKWDDHFYNAGCITGADQDDIPWRFLHPEVGILWRLGRRLSSDRRHMPPDDPESRALAPFLAGSSQGRFDPLPLFRRAVETLARHPQTGSVLELLERMEAAGPPCSRQTILRETAARARTLLPERSLEAQAVERVLDRLRSARPGLFSGVEFNPVEEVAGPGSRRIRLALSVSGREMVVDLLDARSKEPCFFRSRHFRAVHRQDAPPPSPRESRQLAVLLRLIDAGVDEARKAERTTASPSPLESGLKEG